MVAIIGGGITGLLLAWHLQQKGMAFTLYEATHRVGGNIRTEKQGPYLLEKGPNTLQLNDKLYTLFHQLGISEDLIHAEAEAKYRYVLKEGKYKRLPSGPLSLLFTSTFSFKAKRKLLQEPKLAVQEIAEESIDHFFRRRLGDEWTDYAVYPFISGIYAGDPKQLLIREAFPKVKQWEREYGSIMSGMRKGRKPQTHKGIISFPGGLEHITRTLYHKLKPHIGLALPIHTISQKDAGYLLHSDQSTFEAAQVVCTTPAHITAQLFQNIESDFAHSLSQIYYPPVAMIHSAYKRNAIPHPLDGFGALHNQLETTQTLGTIFSSTIFRNRCPNDEVLLTTFIGGTLHSEKVKKEEGQLFDLTFQDHQRFLGATDRPVFQSAIQWERAIPQYDQHSLAYQSFIDPLKEKGLHFGGNWTGGISVGSCIEKAEKLAADCFLV